MKEKMTQEEKGFYIDIDRLLQEPNGTHHREKAKSCMADAEKVQCITDCLHHSVLALAGLVSFFDTDWYFGQDWEKVFDIQEMVERYIVYAKPGTIQEMLPNIQSAAQDATALVQVIIDVLDSLLVLDDFVNL